MFVSVATRNNYNNYILYYTILVIKNHFLYWKKSDIIWKTLTSALFNFSGKQWYRNTLTTDFARAFMNDHTGYYGRSYTSQVLCNKIGPLVSQDLPTHRPKSHDFFDAHLTLFTWTILLTSQKQFIENEEILNQHLAFLSPFLMWYINITIASVIFMSVLVH